MNTLDNAPWSTPYQYLMFYQPIFYQQKSLTVYKFVHDDIITDEHFLYYWPFVRRIHLPKVDSPYKLSVMFDVFFGVSLNKLLNKQ